ncbi:diheme cytochrome c [Rhodoferax sp.]|uniref:diheme cytochrome c n=1 Tax=Rhodoferax sp. TaxID=50421 RepID=UPI002631EAF3|nr:diheme cytochrome c [Rhodoferax sp.]MDD5480724.1 diheme cytochrome c [Rhodoferax sp.]
MKFAKPLLVLAMASLSLAACAKYNGEDRGRPVMPSQSNAKWVAECSGCHMAYPPGLLPAASWKKVMGGLDKHFGTDASLSAADNAEITNYLVTYESNRWTSSAAPLRITDGEWFKVKHIGKGNIDPAVWSRASVKSKGNCAACHQGAERGDFNENSTRIPN